MNDWNATTCLYFEKIIKKSEYVTKEEIVVKNDHYYVPSENDKQLKYCVDPNIGICSCKEGMHGRFCKHQRIIFTFYKMVGVNFPPVTIEDRFAVSKLALGDKAPNETFYEGLISEETLHQNIEESSDQLSLIKEQKILFENTQITNENNVTNSTVVNNFNINNNTQKNSTILK